MKTLIKIAWRNLWRNRRRTLLTVASVVLALVLALFMRSMQLGSYEQMIKAGVNQVGYLQIHSKGYWEEQSIDRAFFDKDSIDAALKSTSGISKTLPFLQTFSLASYGNLTKGVLVDGIKPDKEDSQTNLSGKIVKGDYLTKSEHSVIIGDKLAQYLKMDVGDSLVLIGQGFRGITAYGIYPISGIFHLPSLQMNSQLVYMNLKDAQAFVYPYQEGLLTGISVFLNDPDHLPQVKKSLLTKLGKHYEATSWKVMLSDILQAIEVDNVSGELMLFILYIVVAFSIFSTILMMTMERSKQYSVMISVGMQRWQLVLVSMIETVIISLIGVLIGLLIISPVLYYFHENPIPLTGSMADLYLQFNIKPVLPFSVKPHIFASQTAIIFILSLVSVLYPVVFISRFNILNASRH